VIKLVSLYLAHSGLTSGLESSPEPNQEFKQNKTPINYSNNNFPRTVRDNILFITNNANDKCPRPNSPQTRPFSHRESFGNGAQILLARYHFLTHFLPAQLSVTRVLRFVGVLLDQLQKENVRPQGKFPLCQFSRKFSERKFLPRYVRFKLVPEQSPLFYADKIMWRSSTHQQIKESKVIGHTLEKTIFSTARTGYGIFFVRSLDPRILPQNNHPQVSSQKVLTVFFPKPLVPIWVPRTKITLRILTPLVPIWVPRTKITLRILTTNTERMIKCAGTRTVP
jgi:hypothetical protein